MNIESLTRLCLYTGVYLFLTIIALRLGGLHHYLEITLFTLATIVTTWWRFKLNSLNADLFHKELIVIVAIIFAITAMFFLISDVVSPLQSKIVD